jgi:hypothetical protein
MHIKYCTYTYVGHTVYQQSYLYKGIRDILGREVHWDAVKQNRIFYMKWTLLRQLVINYCSLLTSVPDPWNFGTDPDPLIRFRKKLIRVWIRIFDIKACFLGFWKPKMHLALSKIHSFKKNYYVNYERNISRNFVDHPSRAIAASHMKSY